MLNKIIILLVSLVTFIAINANAQEEEQRKYIFKSPSARATQIVNVGGLLNGLTVKKHSDFEYFDIYLDTDNLTLVKNKLSLRMRYRTFGDGTTAFGIQLKSEMLNPSDIRMEIDDELDRMQVFHQQQKHLLTDVLRDLFIRFNSIIGGSEMINQSQDAIMQEKLAIIRSWLAFKINAAIAPFQKLKHLKIDSEELQTLKPVLIGKSIRARSHVYIDRKNTIPDLIDFPSSEMAKANTPEILQSEQFVWLMENSFDRAIFFGVEKNGFHIINEYEVENKYRPLALGRSMLNHFEKEMIEDLGGEVNLESKYLQSMKAIFELTE